VNWTLVKCYVCVSFSALQGDGCIVGYTSCAALTVLTPLWPCFIDIKLKLSGPVAYIIKRTSL